MTYTLSAIEEMVRVGRGPVGRGLGHPTRKELLDALESALVQLRVAEALGEAAEGMIDALWDEQNEDLTDAGEFLADKLREWEER